MDGLTLVVNAWVDVSFESCSVERLFTDPRLLVQTVGFDLARAIKKRFEQLKAAPTFSIYLDTRLGSPHSLVGELKGYYGVSISGNIRMIIRPIAAYTDPESLKGCSAVIIKGVKDYHGRKHRWLIS